MLVAGFGFATLVVPLVFAMLFIESWTQALQQAGLDHVLAVVVMGFGWGTDERLATVVVWLPIWWGGGVAMVLCSLLEIARQKTFDRFTSVGAGRDFLLCAPLIGLCMPAVHVSFGIGAHYLGDTLGRTVGWAISIALSLVAGNAVGFMTGEWRGATARSKNFLYAGIVVLIVATVCLAFASSLGTG